jgi:sensor histidine kinase YesM
MMDLNKKIAEYKVMALRSAMNPHFIFNSLNSIQYYIGVNEKKLAITYLSLFSKLIRNILNSSVNVRNTLEKELETLTYYMQMERMRFEDKFTFEIIVNETIEQEYIQVPSLIFQPFVENAILHGLMHKDATGRIEVRISEKEDGILCEITDDGIGREAARKITENQNKSHTSFGVSLTKARLDVINKTENVSVNYIDLKDSNGNPAGTKVELFIVC